MPDAPVRFVRVTWDWARGWPHPTRWERTARNFTSPETAGRQLSIIEGLPSHCRLISVAVSTDVTWREIDPAILPRPERETANGGLHEADTD